MRTKYIYVTSHVRASTRHWDHWHKNARSGEGTRGCHKAEDKGRLGIYFVEDKLKREVDWLIFLDSDDYTGRTESGERQRQEPSPGQRRGDHAAIFMSLRTSAKEGFPSHRRISDEGV